jgi:hypothetical protein
MKKGIRIGICILIGVVGAEMVSSFILIGLGMPGPAAFTPEGWLARLTDPFTLVLAAFLSGFAFLLSKRFALQKRSSITVAQKFHTGPDPADVGRHKARRG